MEIFYNDRHMIEKGTYLNLGPVLWIKDIRLTSKK